MLGGDYLVVVREGLGVGGLLGLWGTCTGLCWLSIMVLRTVLRPRQLLALLNQN